MGRSLKYKNRFIKNMDLYIVLIGSILLPAYTRTVLLTDLSLNRKDKTASVEIIKIILSLYTNTAIQWQINMLKKSSDYL